MQESLKSTTADTAETVRWWEPTWRFLLETLTGVLIFGIIAAAAVALHYIVENLASLQIDSIIVVGLRIAEYGLFAMDLILFARFLFVTTARTWKNL